MSQTTWIFGSLLVLGLRDVTLLLLAALQSLEVTAQLSNDSSTGGFFIEAEMIRLLQDKDMMLAASAPRLEGRFRGAIKKEAYPGDYTGLRRNFCIVVSSYYRFIFVRLPKTGGSTIMRTLMKSLCPSVHSPSGAASVDYCGDGEVLDHGQESVQSSHTETGGSSIMSLLSTPACVRKLPPPETWSSYFVFTFVRSPYTRRFSTVAYCRIGTWCNACTQAGCGRCSEEHCHAQAPYIISPLNTSYVDYVGHMETLESDLQRVLMIIQHKYVLERRRRLHWLNETPINVWVNIGSSFAQSAFLGCPSCLRRVGRMYEEDAMAFGYDYPVLA